MFDSDFLNYKKTLYNLLQQGATRESRLGDSYEIVGYSLKFPTGQLFYKKGMLRLLGWYEAVEVVSGNFNSRNFKLIAPKLKYPYHVNDSGYGIRLAPQMETVVKQLQTNPESRRAIAHIGQPIDTGEQRKPCVDSYQWLIRGDKLDMIASIRSWDMVTGFVYDTMVMGVMNSIMANLIHCQPGIIHCHAGSAHVYKKDLDVAWNVGQKAKWFQLDEAIDFNGVWGNAVTWANIARKDILSAASSTELSYYPPIFNIFDKEEIDKELNDASNQ